MSLLTSPPTALLLLFHTNTSVFCSLDASHVTHYLPSLAVYSTSTSYSLPLRCASNPFVFSMITLQYSSVWRSLNYQFPLLFLTYLLTLPLSPPPNLTSPRYASPSILPLRHSLLRPPATHTPSLTYQPLPTNPHSSTYSPIHLSSFSVTPDLLYCHRHTLL